MPAQSSAAWTPLIPLALLAACVREQGPPDPGACAVPPEDQTAYTWGEIGIGTCLAGPADMRFFEQDGKTYLAVTNANPYLDFATGSLLVIDWESVDPTVDRNYMDQLDAGAIRIDDYVGGFDILADRRQALVTGRESPAAPGRSANDRAYLIDLDPPLAPHRFVEQPRVDARDDPFPVVADDATGRVYVGNLTDHSVGVYDTTGDLLVQIDVAPGTVVSPGPLDDADGSGTVAEIHAIDVIDPKLLTDDAWTLSWIDGTARVWVPDAAPDGRIGLSRYTDVGLGPVASALGLEVDPDDFGDVGDFTFATTDLPRLWFSDAAGTTISRVDTTGYVGEWDIDSIDGELVAGELGAWDELIGGPAVVLVGDTTWMLYDGRIPGGTPALGRTQPSGQALWDNAVDPFLSSETDPDFLGFEDPSAWYDAATGAVLVWTTALLPDGSRGIGLTSTDDQGDSWAPVELVLSDPAADVAAPVVTRRHGRFELWYTRDDGTTWTHWHAWSWDGRTWFDAVPWLDSPLARDAALPIPRVAVQTEDTAAWRVEGVDRGTLGALVTSGVQFIDAVGGLSIQVASGQELNNDVVPDDRAELGLIPGSLVEIGGTPTLYVTELDDARSRIGVLQQVFGAWVSAGSDLIPSNTGGNAAGVGDPVVVADGSGWVMFYAATDRGGITTIRRATSDDGLVWTPIPGAALVHDDDWDGVEQRPHSVRVLSDGTIRLWYSGSSGSRPRIGSAIADSPTGRLRAEEGRFDPWRFEPGVPGSFDDGGVRDPLVYSDDDGVIHLVYAGFDGTGWSLGHAVQDPDTGDFLRPTDPISDRTIPSMTGEPLSFSEIGARSPVLVSRTGDDLEILYAGLDGFTQRIGVAVGRAERLWPALRFPTPGDTMSFTTEQGRTGASVIELAQSTQDFAVDGIGMSSLTLDSDRGFLYVTSKLQTFVYVVDVRDDSGGAFTDSNALDLEGLIQVQNLGALGFRGALIDAVRDRLYLTARNPDGVVIIDLTRLVDDEKKEVLWDASPGVLPLLDEKQDEGAETLSLIGGNGMALTSDGKYLLVAHHGGNGLAVFDLDQDAFGAEVAWLPHIGENPHLVRISPDGRFAVVANYVGEIDEDGAASATLAVIDLDATSPTFLQVLTWLVNK